MLICPTCGKEFSYTSRHPTQKHCSRKCWQLSNYESVSCLGCGKTFLKRKGKRAKYCSAECAFKNRPRQPITKRKLCICEWCGKQFETWQSRPGRFCSKRCASAYGGSVSPGHPKMPQNYITRNCDICGKPYTVHKIFVEKRHSRWCSKECRNIGMSLLKQGKGNPNYRGGTITYRGANWGHQSRKALKRDGYKCQICHRQLGKHDWDYGVHHIKPYREFDGDYETANQLSNLVTLCRRCHGRVEAGKISCPIPLF